MGVVIDTDSVSFTLTSNVVLQGEVLQGTAVTSCCNRLVAAAAVTEVMLNKLNMTFVFVLSITTLYINVLFFAITFFDNFATFYEKCGKILSILL